MTATARRVAGKLRRDGVGATMRQVGSLLGQRVHLDEHHLWYRLDVAGDRPRHELPEGVTISRAGAGEIDAVERFDQSLAEARLHHSEGNQLWLAREGAAVLFACWIFPSTSPVLAAPGGRLEVPDGVVVLENSFTAPGARGRGIAPASWCSVADALAGQGVRTMITKVETDNVPSRKAVMKAGFAEFALMHLTVRAGRRHTSLTPAGDGLAGEMARRLNSRPAADAVD